MSFWDYLLRRFLGEPVDSYNPECDDDVAWLRETRQEADTAANALREIKSRSATLDEALREARRRVEQSPELWP